MPRLLKLDRMEIIGFKSFYGRTRFDFPDGITAVVGPNGCGKSNIGDAISWVLGEQKASSLRSDRMEDVIFNGSEGRRPLGMAEVSLHFRNLAFGSGDANGNGHAGGNGHAAAPLVEEIAPPLDAGLTVASDSGDVVPAVAIASGTDAASDPDAEAREEAPARPAFDSLEEVPESVVVTRRLYRSGESEYILNGERCRLKDIQDLMARTDVGSRLYSTIEQGKIDQILQARPKERRALFEEAAAILGYKAKRRQAEGKLEAAQANLLRLSDITSEVEKQIGSLKRQAAKARRYRRLMETWRERRMQAAKHRLVAFEADRGEAGAAAERLRAEEAAAAAALAREEADLETLRAGLETGEQEARTRRDAIHALDLEIDRLRERLRSGDEQSRDLEARIVEAAADLEALAARGAALRERRAAAAAACETAEQALAAATGALEGGAAAVREEGAALAARETSLENARADLLRRIDAGTEAGRRRATLDEQARAERAAHERLIEEIARLTDEGAAHAAALAELETRRQAGRSRREEMISARAARAGAEKEAAADVEAAERRLEGLRVKEAATGERLAALQALARRASGADGLAALLDGAAGFTARGIAGERLEVPRGLERAVEAALGDLLEAVVVDSPEDGARGVAHLRRTAGGRAAFAASGDAAAGAGGQGLPLSLATLPGVVGLLAERISGAPPPAVAALLGRTVIVESLEAGIAARATHPGWDFVTPQGDIARASGVIVGGEGHAADHGLLARRAETQETLRDLEATATARQAEEERVAAARRALGDAQDRLRGAESAVQEAERALLECDLLLERKRSDVARVEGDLGRAVEERGRLEGSLAAAAEESVALERAAAEADEARRAQESEIARAAEEVAAARARLEILGREAAAAGAEAAGARARLDALRRELQEAETGLGEVGAAAARRVASREESGARLAGLAEQRVTLVAQVDAATLQRADAAARDEAAHAGLAYDRSRVHARDQAAREQRAAHAALRERQQDRALHLARLEAQIESLERTCREDLGVTFDALRALDIVPDERPIEEREREIDELKAEIESIGPVNLMAIEQHAELEERFGFLTAQKKDLEESIAALQETIRRINRHSRERFMQAFEAVQGYFQETFAALFGGGQAALRLQEDEQDVLEAGIEIMAQPPGKRLQKIALLSGGERALTAAALLFSLFRYRPSPFCVLDEVDAPLDEANVERFTRLLQRLREDTQFIVITHNRKSMEAADLLYGVTMEEPGVSKVLPLRFD